MYFFKIDPFTTMRNKETIQHFGHTPVSKCLWINKVNLKLKQILSPKYAVLTNHVLWVLNLFLPKSSAKHHSCPLQWIIQSHAHCCNCCLILIKQYEWLHFEASKFVKVCLKTAILIDPCKIFYLVSDSRVLLSNLKCCLQIISTLDHSLECLR